MVKKIKVDESSLEKNLNEVEDYLKRWLSTYGHTQWKIEDVPLDADSYIKAEKFIYVFQQFINDTIHGSKNLKHDINSLHIMCDMVIDNLKLGIKNPYSNIELQEYLLQGVQDAKKSMDWYNLNDRNKKKNSSPYSLKDLFIQQELFIPCVNVLKELNVLGEECNYIGNTKSVFCFWIEALEYYRFIVPQTDRKIYAKLISEYFKPFTISESTFGKPNPRAEKKYKSDLKLLLDKVYQKGKLAK